jgi:tetratricopeptide (TPR) repeat protein
MFKKVAFISLAVLGIVFSQIPGEYFGDASAQLEQAASYANNGQFKEAEGIYKTIMTDYAGTDYAFQSQKELTMLYIAWDRQTQAEATFLELVADFSENEHVAQAIHEIARKYHESKNYEKADQLYQYIIDNWPIDEYAMWSKNGQVMLNITLGNDANDANDAVAQAIIDEQLADFSDHEYRAILVYYIAEHYHWVENYEKAEYFYQYVIENWSSDKYAVWSQMGMVRLDIERGEMETAEAAINSLIANFSSGSDLPYAIAKAADQHYEKAFTLENEGLSNRVQNYFQQAIAICEILINEFPGSVWTPGVCFKAGDCYRKLGEYEKSIEFYQKVIDDYPEDDMAWHALFMVGRNTEMLKKSGVISGSVADTEIRAAYEQLLENYPDCKAAKIAYRWLSRHNSY